MYVTRTFCKMVKILIKLSFLCFSVLLYMNPEPTFMQPTIVVVNAELYCVHSTVEYIRTNLKNNVIILQMNQGLCQHKVRFHNVNATWQTKGDCELRAMA